jgi:DNA-directed RNA polymerase
MSDDKRTQQTLRETHYLDEAVKRFEKALQDSPEQSDPGRALIRDYWKPLSAAIAEEQELQRTSRMEELGYPLLVLNADVLAVVTLHCIIWANGSKRCVEEDAGDEEDEEDAGDDKNEEIDSKTMPLFLRAKSVKQTALMKQIANRCESAWRMKTDPERDAAFERCVKSSSQQKARDKQTAREKLDGPWSRKNADIRFGERLLSLARNVGIIDIRPSDVSGEREAYIVLFTQGFGEAFEAARTHFHDLISPLYRPMVCPPTQWGPDLNDGGYLENAKTRDLHLVKHRNEAALIEYFKGKDIATVRKAINALQETPWRINRTLYRVMSQVAEMRLNKELQELTLKERQRLAPLHRRNAWTLINVLKDKCDICADLLDENAIYFPYQLDYRGRAYCMSAGVNPQSDDSGRSLLEFAEGKRLGKNGLKWLAIHLANARGKDRQGQHGRRLDKIRFEDRISWVTENDNRIRSSARDPLANRWWMSASKPWRFLSACFEWEKAHSTDGEGFISHLPIAIDGTCNGLQHLSALRLDENSARETNVLPAELPRDIYQTIANLVKESLEEDWTHGNEFAEEWRGILLADSDVPQREPRTDGLTKSQGTQIPDLSPVNFDRDVAKAAVMTTPYGVTRQGMTLQLLDLPFTARLHIRGCAPITGRDIKNPGRFIQRLVSSSDPLSAFLVSGWTEAEREMLTGETSEGGRRATLATILNRVVQGPSIFEHDRFAKVKLSDDANELRASAETGLLWSPEVGKALFHQDAMEERSMQLSRYNRILLEDAFPDDIKDRRGDQWNACKYFAEKLQNSIAEVVDPGNTMKRWFQAIAKAVATAGSSICWTAPSGFPVFQEAWKLEKRLIQAGTIRVVLNRKPQKKPVRDTAKEASRIVANVIHSLDAAHMVLTVDRLHADGLKHFGVVHDCYAVHASDVDTLQTALREEFVRMYEVPEGGRSFLERFRDAQQEAVGADGPVLDPVPPVGDLNIRDVLNSKYFFS